MPPCSVVRHVAVFGLLALLGAGAVQAGDAAKAAAYYEDGLGRFEEGDKPGAIIQLKNALQENPNLLTAQVLLGRVSLDLLEFPTAEVAFDKALELGVSPSEIAEPRARLLMALGRAKQLLAVITPDGLYGEDLVEVLTLRAKAHGMLGDVDEAKAAFRLALDTDPRSVRPYLDYVPLLIQAGELEAADEAVAAARALAPEDARVWNLIASMKHVRGQIREALVDYDKALSLDPSHIDARVARAGVLIDLRRDADAMNDLDYLAEHAKREPRSAYLRAVVFERQGNAEGARNSMRETASLVESLSVEYRSANEQLLMLGAVANHGLGALEKAKEFLDTLVRRYPRNAAARRLLASIYLDEGDNARALATVEPVLQLSPNDPQASLLAGRAHLGERRYQQANGFLTLAAEQLKGADARFALGLSQIGLGQRDQGLENIELATRAAPARLDMAGVLTTLYMQKGARKQALSVVARLEKARPEDVGVMNLVGSTRAAAGDLEGAETAFRRVLALAPESVAAKLNLSKIEMATGRLDLALNDLMALNQAHPEDTRVMYELGRAYQQRGDLKPAIDWLRKAAAKQPDQRQPGLALVEALSQSGQAREALTVASEVAIRHPEDLVVLAVLGQAALANGDPKAARQTFRNMTRIAGFDPDAQVRVGRLMLNAGFLDDAAYNVSKAKTARADFVPAHALAIDIALERNDAEKAKAELAQYRALVPANDAQVPRYEAMIAIAAGDDAAALKVFRQLHAKRPDAGTAINLAAVQQRVGDLAAAEDTLRGALVREETPAVLDALAQVLEQRGELLVARDIYRRLFELTPEHAERLRRYALLQLAIKDPGAAATATRARELAPDQALMTDTLGWIHLQTGDVEAALAALRDARLRAPEIPSIRYHLATALARSGRSGEAKAELQAALAASDAFPGRDEAAALLQELSR